MTQLKVRNSSFELLRLLLMVMVVIHHCIVHGLGLSGLSVNYTSPTVVPLGQMDTAFFINAFCISAVNCFILISGYFKINVSTQRFLNLILSIFFYSVIFTIIPYMIKGDWLTAVKKCLFLSHSQYWFVIDYLFLMVFAPMLNMAYDKFSAKHRRMITLGLIIISCYFGFLWNHSANTNGYTIIQFITIYCIGREIAKSNFSLKRFHSILLYIIGSLTVGCSGWILWSYEYNELSWKTTFYNDPILILASIGLFMFFKDLYFHSKLINRLGKSSFGIYLFQSSSAVGYFMYEWIRFNSLKLGGGIFLIIILLSVLISIVALMFDQIRIRLLYYFIPSLMNLIQKWKL